MDVFGLFFMTILNLIWLACICYDKNAFYDNNNVFISIIHYDNKYICYNNKMYSYWQYIVYFMRNICEINLANIFLLTPPYSMHFSPQLRCTSWIRSNPSNRNKRIMYREDYQSASTQCQCVGLSISLLCNIVSPHDVWNASQHTKTPSAWCDAACKSLANFIIRGIRQNKTLSQNPLLTRTLQ